MIGISAYRSNMPKERNEMKTKELISDLRKSGYSFLPIYRKHPGSNSEEVEYEPSFIVFNRRGNEPSYFEELKRLALYWCGKYEQPSVFIIAPDDQTVNHNTEGTPVNEIASNQVYYVNPMPQQLTERMRRINEIMVWE